MSCCILVVISASISLPLAVLPLPVLPLPVPVPSLFPFDVNPVVAAHRVMGVAAEWAREKVGILEENEDRGAREQGTGPPAVATTGAVEEACRGGAAAEMAEGTVRIRGS